MRRSDRGDRGGVGWRRWLLVSWALALAPPIALAEQEADRAEAGDPEAEAREAFRTGVELYGRGEHEAALEAFERAYALRPHFHILFNIGQCAAELGRTADAIAAFERHLGLGGPAIPARRRAEVLGEIERLRGLPVPVTVAVDRPDLEVRVDGATVGRSPLPGPLSLGPGPHVVEAAEEGRAEALARAELRVPPGGRPMEVRLDVEPVLAAPGELAEASEAAPGEAAAEAPAAEAPADPVSPAVAEASAVPDPLSHRDGAGARRPGRVPGAAFYALAAGTLLLAAGTATTGGLALAQHGEFVGLCRDDPRAAELERSGRDLALASDVLLGLTVAAAVASTFVALLAEWRAAPPRRAASSLRNAPWLGGDAGGAQ